MDLDLLTQREKEVFSLIVRDGLTTREEIAKRLFISESTSVCHINAVCQKLGYWGSDRIAKLIFDFYREKEKGNEMKKKLKTEFDAGFFVNTWYSKSNGKRYFVIEVNRKVNGKVINLMIDSARAEEENNER